MRTNRRYCLPGICVDILARFMMRWRLRILNIISIRCSFQEPGANTLHSALEVGIFAEIVPSSLKKGGYSQPNLASLNCLRALALSPSDSDELVIVKVIIYILQCLYSSRFTAIGACDTNSINIKTLKYLVYIKLYMSFAINFFIHLS